MNELRCSLCFYSTWDFKKYRSHIVRLHKTDPSFIVHCSVGNCAFNTRKWVSYRSHLKRKHNGLFLNNIQQNYIDCIEEIEVENVLQNNFTKNILSSAVYALSLESLHNVPRHAVDSLIETVKQLVVQNISLVIEKASIEKEVCEPLLKDIMDSFNAVNTTYKRNKIYTDQLGLVEPQEVFLGTVPKSKNGQTIRERKYGYFVPLEMNLKSLLEMPEVWQFVENGHSSHNEFMEDFCDGKVFNDHPVFQTNKKALQIVLYTDDIEIVNPLGAHVKKHKITVFYFALCNIPPQFRSNLHSMQLVAVAKTQDIKTFGIHLLLKDFVHTVKRLSSGGIEMSVNGRCKVIEGMLVYVPADTPASNWLGGFKEGVSFSYKACRSCNASNSMLTQSFSESDFTLRNSAIHKEKCIEFEKLDKRNRKHFSKVWGITGRSVLCDLQNFDLCQSLVHDPMHIFLEGIMRRELQLILFHFIFSEKVFKLAWLNHKIHTYKYSDLMMGSKPEPIERKQVLGLSPFRQTAASMLCLCEVLPYVIGLKARDDDEKWLNFLRLVQLIFLCTSPVCTADTVDMITQLVITHNYEFVRLYPKSSITPKMHYCVHLARQMLNFGPLRHLWCMRFEGKHGFFKSKKWKCFKNLPLSMARKHQLYMCHKQNLSDGSKNPNFLYEGDFVKEGNECKFSDLYPELLNSFSILCAETFTLNDCPVVYVTDSVVIHGLSYKVSCVIILEVTNWIPTFGMCREIFIYKDEKFLVVEKLVTECFVEKILSYKLMLTGELIVLNQNTLTLKWPLWPQTVDGDMYIMNKYSHFCEFF